MKTIKLIAFITLLFVFKNNIASNNSLITPANNTCVPAVNITAIPNTYGCYSITANNGVANDPDAYYHWSFDDGTTGMGKTIYHCYSPTTLSVNYTLSLTYNPPSNCGIVPNVFVYTITLNPPSPTICINTTASVSLVANTVTVWPMVAIPEIIFSYDYGDNSPSTYDNTHTYASCGNYIVTVSQYDMLSQTTCYSYGVVNNNCGINTGITKNDIQAELSLYPNPSKELLNIQSGTLIDNIQVFDILGRNVDLPIELKENYSKLYLENILPGAYFVKIQLENHQETYKKFIKE